MGHKDIFQQDAIETLMRYTFSSETGRVKLVFRPIDYSAYEDSQWLLKSGVMSPTDERGRHYTSESGVVQTPQDSWIVWDNYQTLHTFTRTNLSVAVKLYRLGLLFEYVDYNQADYFGTISQLLHRHYLH
jgi:hypothetical protein